MFTWIKNLPKMWSALALLAFVGLIVALFGQMRACGYDKARREYEATDKIKAAESEKLKARAEASERRVAELEPKLAAYEKLADDKKRLDESISDKIDAVVKEGQKEEEATNTPTDCWTRAQRTCDKFAALKPPIAIDCEAYKRKICGK